MKKVITIEIQAKTDDRFEMVLVNDSGKVIEHFLGYPRGIFGKNSDTIKISIDAENGHILNWNVSEMNKFIQENFSEDIEPIL